MTLSINSLKFGQSVLNTLLTQMFSAVLNALAFITLARVLGPSNNGIYHLAVLLPELLILVFTSGVPASSTFFLSSEKYDSSTVFTANVLFTLLFSALAIGAGLVIFGLFSGVLFVGVPNSLLYIALILIPLRLGSFNLSGILIGLKKFKVNNFFRLIQPLLFLSTILVLMKAKSLSAHSAVIALAISLLLTDLMMFVYCFRLVGKISVGKLRNYLKIAGWFGMKAQVGSLFSYIHLRGDLLLINYFGKKSEVGNYSVASDIGEQLWMISSASSTILLPTVSSAASGSNNSLVTAKLCRVITLVLGFAAILIGLGAGFLLPFFFTAKYNSAIIPLGLLLPGIIAMGISQLLSTDLTARGKLNLSIKIGVTFACLNMALNFFVIPVWGITGAAIVSSITYIMTCLVRMHYYCRITSQSLHVFLPRRSDLEISWQALQFRLTNLFNL